MAFKDGLLPPPSPPPPTKGGVGKQTPAGEGVGESQFGRIEKKPSTLSILRPKPSSPNRQPLRVLSKCLSHKGLFLFAGLSTTEICTM